MPDILEEMDVEMSDIGWSKGTTINDLGREGAEEKSKKNLFLKFKIYLKIIFSSGRPFEIYFFLEKGLRNFFFSISSGPNPRSLMVVP